MLEIFEIRTLPYLRDVLTKHLNNLQSAFARIENTMLENIPVLQKK